MSLQLTRPLKRWRLFGLGLSATVLVAVVIAIVTLGTDKSGSSSSNTRSACEALVRFRNVVYTGQGIPAGSSLERGRRVGEGTLPPCNDNPGEPVAEGGRRALVALGGIPPLLAVGAADQPNGIYVAAGRCAGWDAWEMRLLCLRQPLTFMDRMYAATNLPTANVAAGPVVGQGRIGVKSTVVRRLDSIEPRDAVVTSPGGSVVYLSDQGCFISPGRRTFEQELVACLKHRRS
jgi:hypothetical protein